MARKQTDFDIMITFRTAAFDVLKQDITRERKLEQLIPIRDAAMKQMTNVMGHDAATARDLLMSTYKLALEEVAAWRAEQLVKGST